MDLGKLQRRVKRFGDETLNPFRSGTEIMLAITEEAGEVATEVALLERVGTKAQWSKQPSVERLGVEMTHVLNLLLTLASFYRIDLEQLYAEKESTE